MRPQGRSVRNGAIAASVVLHAGLLAALALQAPTLSDREDRPFDVRIVPVVLAPRSSALSRPHPQRTLRPHAAPRSEAILAPVVLPAAPVATPSGSSQANVAAVPPGVQAALRRQLGCQERSGLRLTRDEHGDCNERLGRGALAAPYLKAPIPPEIRAYYDQVAAAKEPQGPLPPLKARGRLGLFEAMPTGMKGHGPGLGCHLALGQGQARATRPPHGLKLGPLPCFIVPPAGSLSPDVDVQNPDEVVRDKAP